MQFFKSILSAAIALATLTSATNTVQFVNQDATTRHIVFTSQENMFPLPELVISGNSEMTQTFPTGYIGNFYTYNEGAENVPGMLGEVRFDGWNGLVFFDVSSIVNAADTEGVKVLYPAGQAMSADTTPVSGCLSTLVKCLNQYNAPDDIATKATSVSDLVCLIGNKASTRRTRRSGDVYPRSYVTGVEGAQEE